MHASQASYACIVVVYACSMFQLSAITAVATDDPVAAAAVARPLRPDDVIPHADALECCRGAVVCETGGGGG